MSFPTGDPIDIEVRCPHCGHLSRNGAQATGAAQAEPTHGALVLCAMCAHLARIVRGPLGQVTSRALSRVELAEAMRVPEVATAVRLIRAGVPSGRVVQTLRRRARGSHYDCPN